VCDTALQTHGQVSHTSTWTNRGLLCFIYSAFGCESRKERISWRKMVVVHLAETPPLCDHHVHHPHPLNMILLSEVPSWWPTINSTRFYSYLVGSWKPVWWSWRCLDYGLAVASSAEVMYDWSEPTWYLRDTDILIPCLTPTFRQECHFRSNHLVKIGFIDWTSLGEQYPTSKELHTTSWGTCYLLRWNMTQAIMIARLYAMHRGSRGIPTSLIVIFWLLTSPVE